MGISYDTPAILRDFSTKHHVEFPLLADPESKLIRRFHALDPTTAGETGQHMPPATWPIRAI